MTTDEMGTAVMTVAADPMAGDLIVGSRGCRKVRLAGRGKGKSGGYRLITFYKNSYRRCVLVKRDFEGRA